METNRKKSRITGILFLLPLLTYGTGDALISNLTRTPGYLAEIVNQPGMLIAGSLLLFINSMAVVGIGIWVYPILAGHNKTTALAYFSSRLIESIVLIVGIISLLLLLNISGEYVSGSEGKPHLDTLGALAIRTQYFSFQLAMMALGLGGLFFCGLLYRSGLIPPFLSVWGLLGYVLLLAGALLEICGLPCGVALSIPGGLFEIFLGAWLIIKGFKTPVT